MHIISCTGWMTEDKSDGKIKILRIQVHSLIFTNFGQCMHQTFRHEKGSDIPFLPFYSFYLVTLSVDVL